MRRYLTTVALSNFTMHNHEGDDFLLNDFTQVL